MGTRRGRRRKAKAVLPPIQHYIRPPAGARYWRMGGPVTRGHEAEAKAMLAAKGPGRLGRIVLRVLGYPSTPHG